MQALKVSEVLSATGGTLICGNREYEICRISTDSREIESGDLFIPIVGERFDGHDFAMTALESGAAGIVTQKIMEPLENKFIIKVDDTLKALGAIAAYYRQKFRIPFTGITGSVGKTSTKEMVAGVIGRKFNVLKTDGNFNNEIGLPLMLFKLDSYHEAGVLEMGMSGFGEISRLTAIVKPDIAVITNIGVSHIEKLGSRQNILKAKLEILEGLDKNGLVVLNGDDKLLYGTKDLTGFRTVYYGMEDGLDYQAYNVKSAGEQGIYFEISVGSSDYSLHVPSPGVHNVYNALAAIAVGVELGIPMDDIIEGIASFNPGKMRMDIISHKGMKIINDTYNASPQSMEAAINVLADMGENKRTIAILGDMLEMGDFAYQAHIDVGKFAVSKDIDYIITIGNEGNNIAIGAKKAGILADRVFSFHDNKAAIDFIKPFAQEDDIILIKGSRGMKMEEIVHALTDK